MRSRRLHRDHLGALVKATSNENLISADVTCAWLRRAPEQDGGEVVLAWGMAEWQQCSLVCRIQNKTNSAFKFQPDTEIGD